MPTAATHTHRATHKPAAKHDAIALLKADHREVASMIGDFLRSDATQAKKLALVRKICKALEVHTQIEEEIFYPAAREALNAKGEPLLDEAEVEHTSIKEIVASLSSENPDARLFDAQVKVLGEYVRHHVKEEETKLFPRVRRAHADLKELGSEMAERKAELMDSRTAIEVAS